MIYITGNKAYNFQKILSLKVPGYTLPCQYVKTPDFILLNENAYLQIMDAETSFVE